ncbi:MAG TPA: L-threonylcarbamoyladenylate synthase [Phycisphaerae bacterium]|nr:L-threonylcarbamoyladenylate synthase [Phycisphaerae bacterium]HOJ73542.1 L-threonylcarbamoyladenylate synthase [Phycisphaerae bacterium]HOM51650.1 L-threonylcarbamoyladenylate synthase [Phycisphaerae bacterium]HON65513.1 L-threonylcarbamoyladenylate synthase [Phycisphaerae bacterium]HOQ86431.1 L-threonylcarbamoyladenylate synthase [Phycisphaerae bacterium]
MATKVVNLETASYSEAIREAADVLTRGGLVVFPTETVYGVGACATLPEAVERLRVLKSRTDGKPFTVHIGQKSAIHRFVPEMAGTARRLVEKTWPGPLTIIFEVADAQATPVIQETSPEHVPAMYHNGTIGVRCPDDHVASDLLTQTSLPVVAASANLAGNPAPVTAEEALADLDGRVDLVLDAGRSRYAKASTIVQVDAKGYRVLREGILDERTIRRLNRTNFLLVCSGNTCRSPMAAGLLRRLLAEKLQCREDELAEKGYYVESAGTGACSGAPATPEAIEVLRAKGIEIAGHRSQPLTLEQINRADYIFAMTGRQAENIKSLAAHAEHRVQKVGDEDIEDPIGGTEEEYRACANQIESALRRRLEEVVL